MKKTIHRTPVKKRHSHLKTLTRLRLIEHKHTGKFVHFRHTSHASLFVIVAFLGFVMLMTNSFAIAQVGSGTTIISGTVRANPPTVGAVIISPNGGTELVGENVINVSGTCAENTFVTVLDNAKLVGSTTCTSAGIFSLKIQLVAGVNKLTAWNYDNFNQAGPSTPAVIVTLLGSIKTEVPVPILPTNPTVIPNITNPSKCSEYITPKLTIGGQPHASLVCVPRLFLPNTKQVFGLLVWGGNPPYAVYLDFGDSNNKQKNLLMTIDSPKYVTFEHNYAMPGVYNISLEMRDSFGQQAITQTSTQVSGVQKSPTTSLVGDVIDSSSWLGSPVPMYILALAITVGFWAGDIFDRKFGTKYRRLPKKAHA